MKRTLLCLTLLLALATPAKAGLFDDDEARRRIDAMKLDIDQRLQRLDTMSRAQLDLANTVEAMRQEIASLRGQLEVLGNTLEQANQRQKDFYLDLDTRLRKLESRASEPQKAAEPQPDVASESREYETAITLLRNGKHVDAAVALRNFIKTYPKSSFQASAHFWAANAYYQARDWATAQDYYSKMASLWPEDPLAPDALLGVANCQQDSGDTKAATDTLKKLVAKYGASDAAKTAQLRLKKKK